MLDKEPSGFNFEVDFTPEELLAGQRLVEDQQLLLTPGQTMSPTTYGKLVVDAAISVHNMRQRSLEERLRYIDAVVEVVMERFPDDAERAEIGARMRGNLEQAYNVPPLEQ